jgi:hypothetical protein
MTDLYLKFADQAQADSVLYTVTDEVTDADGVVVQEASSKPNFANIDVLGTLYEAIPADAEEGYEPVAKDGYHVNVRVVGSEDASALVPFSVVPTVPKRIWG